MNSPSNNEEIESSSSEEEDSVEYWRGRYDESKEIQEEVLDLLEQRIKHLESTLWQQYALGRSLVSGAMSSLVNISIEEISGLVSIPITINGLVQLTMSGDIKIGTISLVSGLCFLGFALFKYLRRKKTPEVTRTLPSTNLT